MDQFGIIKKDVELPTTGPDSNPQPTVSLKDISGHWGESAIKSGFDAGYITMVRAAKLGVNTKASLSFSDKNSIPAWAVPYVATAVKEGLVNGVGQNRFAPQQVATRAEAAAFIAKLLNVKN
ncbi:S-layer homology domain-containing protein [Paenibacillus macquariensis]|uniref:S-layer homology domain-containing protein n=1 Tax=Paenibacillus macquariensis TaxID=948756 RepID=A0ABY1KF78_9BACL|nr:S-layer homology domain-containing protein [Paenibacillus macquariensis]MEC0093902.1 S-layer homology domain-containing protein [Paenibacillus macquariensis]OAB33040.1 hypothetical protein PMSM_15880 [Paenibacillus macquariensis subsp. macquariensis]SIR58999.1 S-layer homology domain-containing protein [Paenibacillus macquariensis]